MKVFILINLDNSAIIGVFDSEENAEKFADHYKYTYFTIEDHPVETLKNWPRETSNA